MSDQLMLLLRDSRKKVSLDVILAQHTFRDALKLCKVISGLDDKQICSALDIDPAQWSRIWSGNAHFPENKVCQFMDVCENKTPLIWLAYVSGYSLQPSKNELETENDRLKSEIDRMKSEREIEKRATTELLKTMGIGR